MCRWCVARLRQEGQAGQASLELVSYALVVTLVVVACVQGLFVTQAVSTAQQAARDGARAYAMGGSEADVRAAVERQAPDWAEVQSVGIAPDAKAGSVEVEVTVEIPLMAGRRTVDWLTVSRSAVMPTVPEYEKPASRIFGAGGGPRVSGDGTYRVPSAGSGRLDPSTLCALSWAPNRVLRCDAAAAFEQLNAAYRARFGKNIVVTDAYRDYAAQVAVWAAKPSLAAIPGTSNHGWGLAVDLGGGINQFGSEQHSWMRANAPAFGFQHPSWARSDGSKPEAWHWEYVGVSS